LRPASILRSLPCAARRFLEGHSELCPFSA
jgi:hypothetical protein